MNAINSIAVLSTLALLSVACGADKFSATEEFSAGGANPTGDGDGDTSSGGQDASGGKSGEAGGDGSGGNSNTGGTGGNNTGSTGGSDNSGGSGGNGCVPKTCQEVTFELTNNITLDDGAIGTACGAFDDGCGGQTLCGCQEPDSCGIVQDKRIECTSVSCRPLERFTEENICSPKCTPQPWQASCGSNNYTSFSCPGLYESESEKVAEYNNMTSCHFALDSVGLYGTNIFCCE